MMTILPEIASKTKLIINDRTYPIIEAGEGPLVICLHGFPDNYETYHKQIEPIANSGFRIICPMMPGYAPGTQPSSSNNSPVFACKEIIAMIEVLLKTSDNKKCHLVGHDWGAIVSYMVAAERSDLLYSLTAISIPYNISLLRVLLRCPRYMLNAWYVAFFQLKWLADWMIKRNNWKFIDMLYQTWSPTWKNYEDRLISVKETLKASGVLKSTLSYYRNSVYGLNASSFQFRRMFNGRINVPTLGIRGEKDGCIPEVAWELVSPKSFRNGLTMEVIPGVGHFPQLENPQWISDRIIKWIKAHPYAV